MTAAGVPIAMAGILLIITSRSKALHKFRFHPSTKSKRKSKVGTSTSVRGGSSIDSRSSTPRSFSSNRSTKSVIIKQKHLHHHHHHHHNHPKTSSSTHVDGSGQENPQKVNINVNVISGAPPPLAVGNATTNQAPFSTESSKMLYTGGVPSYQQDGNIGQQEIVADGEYYQHQSNDPAISHVYPDSGPYNSRGLMNVKPAPATEQIVDNSAQQPPVHHQHHQPGRNHERKTFGPSEKQRALNPSDGIELQRNIHNDLDPALDPYGDRAQHSTRGLPPTAPPLHEQINEDDEFFIDNHNIQHQGSQNLPTYPDSMIPTSTLPPSSKGINNANEQEIRDNSNVPTYSFEGRFALTEQERTFSTPDSSPPPYSDIVVSDDSMNRSLTSTLSGGDIQRLDYKTSNV